MKLTTIISNIIPLANAVRKHNAAEIHRIAAGRGFVSAADIGREWGPPPPEREQLDSLGKQFSVATTYMLLVIMYIGRGDYNPDEIMDRYVEISETINNPKYAVKHLLHKLPLGDYLTEGLRRLEEAGIDVDRLV